MKKVLKRCKRVLSVVLTIALVLGITPIQYASAEPEPATGTLTLSETEGISFELEQSELDDEQSTKKQKTISIANLENSEQVKVESTDIISTEWTCEDASASIAKVEEVEEGCKVTALGEGETKINVKVTYSKDGGTETATASVNVKVVVYENVSLTIKEVKPANGLTYPDKNVEVTIEGCPDDLKESLKLNVKKKDGETKTYDVEDNVASFDLEEVGEYEFKPVVTVPAESKYRFDEASVESTTFTVAAADTGFAVEGGLAEVYYTQSVEYTLKANVAGKFTITSTDAIVGDSASYSIEYNPERDTNGIKVNVTYNQVKDSASVKFEFEPNDGGYAESAVEKQVKVNPIPVKAVWKKSSDSSDDYQFTKIYDGEDSFATNEATLSLALAVGGDLTIENVVVKEDSETPSDSWKFTIEDKNTGTKKATLNQSLKLDGDAKAGYILINEKPEVYIQVEPKKLELTSIVDFGTGSDKKYDNNSTAKFTHAPTLKKDNFESAGVIGQDLDDAELTYNANYVKNGENNVGNVSSDVDGLAIKISDIAITSDKIANYKIVNDTNEELVYVLDGFYTIEANADLFSFIGKDEPKETKDVDGIYWFNDEGNKIFENLNDYEFSEGDKEGGIPAIWNSSYQVKVSSTGKLLYAKNEKGHISQPIIVGYDKDEKNGQIFVKISDDKEKLLSIQDAYNLYGHIDNKNNLKVYVNIGAKGSPIKLVEYIESDEPITDVKNIKDEDYVNVVVTLENNIYSATLKETNGMGLSKFYYVRITDFAGNKTYISSEGVIRDIYAPYIKSVSIPEMPDKYSKFNGVNGVNVYDSGDIEVAVSVVEPSEIEYSGIVDIVAKLEKYTNTTNELQKEVIGKFEASDPKASESGKYTNNGEKNDLEAMKNLKDVEKPSYEQVQAATDINCKLNLTNLEDGKYIVTFTAMDKAGNSTDSSTASSKSVEFIIDREAPAISISKGDNTSNEIDDLLSNLTYNGNSVPMSKDENDKYGIYTGGMIEFKVSDLTMVEREVSLTKLESQTEVQIVPEGITNNDGSSSYKYSYNFSSDGTADELYELKIYVKDAGSKELEASKKFRIDATKPKVTIGISEESAKDGNMHYYNKDIVVKYVIDEKGSFDERMFNIMLYQNNDSDNSILEWKNRDTTKDLYKFASISEDLKTIELCVKADYDKHESDNAEGSFYKIVFSGTDLAGNEFEIVNDINDENYVMDTIAPVLEKVEYTNNEKKVFNTVNNKDYIAAVQNVQFVIVDRNIYKSKYKLTSLGSNEQEFSWLKENNSKKTTSIEVPMNGALGDLQTLELEIVDRAGNKAVLGGDLSQKNNDENNKGILVYAGKRSEKNDSNLLTNTSFMDGKFKDSFVVDTIIPEVVFEYLERNPVQTVKETDYFNNYGYVAKVRIKVTEHNFDTSCMDLLIKDIANSSEISYKWENKMVDNYTAEVEFPLEGDYKITLNGRDCAGNVIVLNKKDDKITVKQNDAKECSLNLAVDKTLPTVGDNSKPVIVIEPPTAVGTTPEGQPLYASSITYQVYVYDPIPDPDKNKYCSGIENIKIYAQAENGSTASSEVIDGIIKNSDNMIVDRIDQNGSKGENDAYLFKVTLPADHFNSNGIVLKAKAVDYATNESPEIETAPVAIDTTLPKVTISYDNNNVLNEKYFREPRTATIEVMERNFSSECCTFSVNGAPVSLNFGLTNAGSGSRDDAVWTATYTFSENGDYTVDCNVRDLAQNQGEPAVYNGAAPTLFTIDLLKPVITITFDNNDVANQMYYKAVRTATIRVEERNFRAADFVVNGTATNDGAPVAYPVLNGWSDNGDIHTATIHYNVDALYTLEVKYTDLAGNEATSPDPHRFVVDTLAPELEIYDIVNMSANNGVVRPGVRYSDVNYDASNSEIRMNGFNNGVIPMNGDKTTSHKGVEIKLHDFDHVPELDDLYTMEVKVYDLAGNSSEDKVIFSVNRFGSTYTFDDATNALVGVDGKYYTNAEQKLVIYETNVDTLEFREITCNLNGELKTLVEGTDYTLEQSGSDVSWKQYTYTLKEDNFVNEGNYIVTIYSEDRATNTSNNSTKGKKIEFVVDKTKPSVLISGVENDKQYRAHNKEVTLDIQDNVLLSKLVVNLNGRLNEYTSEQLENTNGKITFNVDSSNNWQTLSVLAYDAAGNESVTDEIRFLITSNIFIQYINNKVAVASSAVAGVVVVGLGFVLFRRKRRDI